jgi:hypothetical protein
MPVKVMRLVLNFFGGSDDLIRQKVHLLRLILVWVGLIMLVAYFCQSPQIKGLVNFTTMNEELLASSALLDQSGFINFLAIVHC